MMRRLLGKILVPGLVVLTACLICGQMVAAERSIAVPDSKKEKRLLEVPLPSMTEESARLQAIEPFAQSAENTGLAVTAAPAAGEEIKWWVIGSGGGASASTNYKLGSTIGQTASGMAQSASYKLNQGFWQNFEPASCCVGTTGNVNMSGIVDLADLALLVAYLVNPVGSKPILTCPGEANINASGIVDLADLSLLVAYLTNPPASKPTLPNCP